ncbi:hypothetical protein GCM10010430_44220 [Kitasatospora cystarginea]|uniref:Uncharacterized protein n=1 Tax=Kitasatospora cystarginea TaxID=58350 RepID=A0ABP5R9R9_9ACTN
MGWSARCQDLRTDRNATFDHLGRAMSSGTSRSGPPNVHRAPPVGPVGGAAPCVGIDDRSPVRAGWNQDGGGC